ncbi:MAG: ABC transporter permease [Planctomycetaceae bacterium]|jgi:lipopolysaccharide transport system permease protein|nr:ABC transporter permease [Planctomycetaceae bacterium]
MINQKEQKKSDPKNRMAADINVKKQSYVTVIESKAAIFRIDFIELWRYRYLIWLYIYRDFVVLYKQTVLGMIWWLLQPFLTTIIFTIVFGIIIKINTNEIPALLFYLSGITLWNYFLYCFLHISQSFIDNRELLKKVYFPRLVIPIAAIISNLMRLALQLLLLVFLYLFFILRGAEICPSIFILGFPLLLFYVALLAFGFGILTASLTIKYRDIILALPFFTQLWMYVSAVLFPFSLVPEKWQFWFSLNPILPAIEMFRYMCFSSDSSSNFSISFESILVNIIVTILFLLIGIFVFNQVEQTFTDII